MPEHYANVTMNETDLCVQIQKDLQDKFKSSVEFLCIVQYLLSNYEKWKCI